LHSSDISHAFLPLTIAKLLTFKNGPVFWPTLYVDRGREILLCHRPCQTCLHVETSLVISRRHQASRHGTHLTVSRDRPRDRTTSGQAAERSVSMPLLISGRASTVTMMRRLEWGQKVRIREYDWSTESRS